MIDTGDTEALESLRRANPLGGYELSTPDGRRWKRRMDESEEYFKRYSARWEGNRKLLCAFEAMIEEFGTYVAIVPSIVSNFISDMYFRNPDPLIQDKGGDKDLGRILTDVAGSIHAESDTESEMKHCFHDTMWAAFGGAVVSFNQKPENAGEDITEETGEVDPATNQPMMHPTGQSVEPTEQKILVRRISPWKCRFDPKGRRWDMSDHRWWAYDDVAYLGPLMRDPTLTPADKARLMAYYGQSGAAFSVEGGEDANSTKGLTETDPEFIRVAMRTIWSRPDHKIYRQPFGASFTFEPLPWDEEWERADEFPYHFIPAPNRTPEDQKNTEGFVPVPWITLIGQHVKNINKAQGLLLGALEHVQDVYVSRKGIFDGAQMEKRDNPFRQFKVIQLDDKVLEKYPSEQDKPAQLKEAFYLLPTGDTKDMQHMATIQHEFNMIGQIMGQGPADRGGVAKSKTATDSLGVQQGIARRMSSNRNDGGKHYNAITRKIFIVMQQRHTLPLRYQRATRFNQKVWDTFTDPRGTLANADLHFDYATGSTEPRTREQEFALRERMATILMPVFQAQQDWRSAMKVASDLVEILNIPGSDSYFDSQLNQLVMQLLMVYRALALPPGDPNAITADNAAVQQKIPELFMQIAQMILTPSELAQVEQTLHGGQTQDQGPQNVGSIAKAPSPGEASAAAGAAGSAAAGAQGGIQFSERLQSPPSGLPQ